VLQKAQAVSSVREWNDRELSIMRDKRTAAPDSTAGRVALWRAMHVQVDPPPHVLEDEIGLRLVAPEDGWRRPKPPPPKFPRSVTADATRQ
jgi:hypothetical protein